MKEQHTPGRLEAVSPSLTSGWGWCIGTKTYILFREAKGKAEERHDPVATKANARRLVACWNACDGISTADLEGLGEGRLSGVLLDPEAARRLAAANAATATISVAALEAGVVAELVAAVRESLGIMEIAVRYGLKKGRRQAPEEFEAFVQETLASHVTLNRLRAVLAQLKEGGS